MASWSPDGDSMERRLVVAFVPQSVNKHAQSCLSKHILIDSRSLCWIHDERHHPGAVVDEQVHQDNVPLAPLKEVTFYIVDATYHCVKLLLCTVSNTICKLLLYGGVQSGRGSIDPGKRSTSGRSSRAS